MAGSLNKVMIIGNVGRDAEMRYTPNGTPTTRFTVAATRRWTSPDGERREVTEWFNIVTWTRLAEQCNEWITKGRLVYVEGRLQTRTWAGADGLERRTVEVVANRVVPLDSRPRPGPAEAEEGPGEGEEVTAEELPF